jgi:hypothetical protein
MVDLLDTTGRQHEMADEKRQIILDLLARNKMRKDTNEAADDLDKLR